MCFQPNLSFKCAWRTSTRLTMGAPPPFPPAQYNAGVEYGFPVRIQTACPWPPLSWYWVVTGCPFFLMCRVLVGAPKADSKYSTSVKSPGAVFKCRIHTNPDRRCTELDMARGKSKGTSCGKTCREDRDDEWMGVSLARQPKADGRVL
ncbi:PREDICTED: integrin alpha-9-like, partial [Miniopterus natalensis]|uniref:integrin alpha-9-like n=1 Tax=Miniopterus natalensis TaxID=291302 RepID=UPI0007A70EF7